MTKIKDLSLKSLEAFQTCANSGSLSAAAKAMNVSTSTIAHHIKNIEDHLGIHLFNHAKKPLKLTSAGERFLADVEPALSALRAAQANVNPAVMQLGRQFRFGAIEDFETDVIPDLAVYLDDQLPNMDFTYQIETSLTLLNMMQDRALDMAFMANPKSPLNGMTYRPILKDPFVLAVPRTCVHDAAELLSGKIDIPYLRFHSSQMIAQQIEAQLQRSKIKLPKKIGVGNNAVLMALVAAGAGWAITTPLLYARSKRSHEDVQLLSLPNMKFSREVGLFSSADCPTQMCDRVHTKLKKLVKHHAIETMHASHPWLRDDFHALELQ